MKLLALETSGRYLGAAIMDGGELRSELLEDAPMRQNELLAPLVQRVLEHSGIKASQIEAVAVSLGPGSFSGLRSGLAFAKGLHFATGAALIGVPTLEAWAEGRSEAVVWLDARKGLLYRGWYKSGAAFKQPALMSRAEAEAELPAGMRPLGDLLDPSAKPSVAAVARLARARLTKGERDEPVGLEPLYLRRPEAEVLWEKRGAR